ncbi:MAG: hypothetical protein JRF39_09515, partial [Deltaproteobacteria bacterium]|nr:hypothetical protein [Deltaproteobacteria bacterium]
MVKKYFFCVSIVAFALLCIGCSEKIEPGNVEQVKKKAVKAPVAVAAIIRRPFMYEAVGTVKAKTI